MHFCWKCIATNRINSLTPVTLTYSPQNVVTPDLIQNNLHTKLGSPSVHGSLITELLTFWADQLHMHTYTDKHTTPAWYPLAWEDFKISSSVESPNYATCWYSDAMHDANQPGLRQYLVVLDRNPSHTHIHTYIDTDGPNTLPPPDILQPLPPPDIRWCG